MGGAQDLGGGGGGGGGNRTSSGALSDLMMQCSVKLSDSIRCSPY